MRISDWSSDVCSSDLHARPEQVDESALVALDQFDLLLEHRDALPIDAEDVEELVIEALRLTLFVMRVLPPLRKAARPPANFLPTEPHPVPPPPSPPERKRVG